jgi:hypothetical protein
VGGILYTDIGLPLFGFVLLWLQRRLDARPGGLGILPPPLRPDATTTTSVAAATLRLLQRGAAFSHRPISADRPAGQHRLPVAPSDQREEATGFFLYSGNRSASPKSLAHSGRVGQALAGRTTSGLAQT